MKTYELFFDCKASSIRIMVTETVGMVKTSAPDPRHYKTESGALKAMRKMERAQ